MRKSAPPSDLATEARKITSLATRSYVFALALIATLAMAGYGANYFALSYDAVNSRLIKLSALQSARFQELVLRSKLHAEQPDAIRQAQNALEVDLLLDIFLATHQNLTLGNETLGIEPVSSGPLQQLYFGRGFDLDGQVMRAAGIIRQVINDPAGTDQSQLARMATGDFAAMQERVTSQYQLEAEAGYTQFAYVQLGILAVLLTSMLLLAVFIFHPLVRALRERTLRLLDAKDQMRKASLTDDLTGLSNMRGVKEVLRDAMQPSRNGPSGLAVMQLDIRGFKSINDTLGHDVGDDILRIVGQRIAGCVRKADTVGRLGGDDFAIILHEVKSDKTAISIAQNVLRSLTHPIKVDKVSCRIGCSIGIALARTGDSIDTPLTNANIALSSAQARAGSDVEVYSPTMRRNLEAREQVARELAVGLDAGQIVPFFQPQIETQTGQISGFEALARWEHPERGLLTPAHFIEVSEQTQLDTRLGEVILKQSLQALQQWDAAGLHVPQVGVNFTSSQLQDPMLVEKIQWAVDAHDLSPERISIEILETILVEDDDHQIVRNIRGLAKLGFGIDLDDFGTGHASISNIRRFAVNRVKIDRSFISRIDSDKSQQQLTAAMINMARSLNVETLAEGVENTEEWRHLSKAGCAHLQGFGIARPMPFEQTVNWITEYNLRVGAGHSPAQAG